MLCFFMSSSRLQELQLLPHKGSAEECRCMLLRDSKLCEPREGRELCSGDSKRPLILLFLFQTADNSSKWKSLSFRHGAKVAFPVMFADCWYRCRLACRYRSVVPSAKSGYSLYVVEGNRGNHLCRDNLFSTIAFYLQ